LAETEKKYLLARNEAGFHEKAAHVFLETAAQSIKDRGRFVVALTGGSTPKKFYSLLSTDYYKSRIDWPHVYLFWGDERCVPPQDDQSNFKMAKETLISQVSIPENNVFRIKGEMTPPLAAAKDYEAQLHAFFKLDYAVPQFDLVLLGVGDDGHIASIFPRSEAMKEQSKWVVSNFVEKLSSNRITLTLPIINNARRILILFQGDRKGAIVKELFREDIPSNRYPVQYTNLAKGEVIWLLDPLAASKLPAEARYKLFHL
jgi:6-phosphogluconolactonase